MTIAGVLALTALCGAAVVWALRAERRAAGLQATLDAERRAVAERLAIVEQARDTLKESFAALSSDALRQNNDSFMRLAKASLDPVKDSLEKLGTHLRETDREHSTLRGHLQSVAETQQLLRQQTQALVSALKSPNQRGRWGEVQLRTVLERAGMLNYCDFVEKSAVTDDGRRLVPDVLVRLPNDACIVIDSKVPIDAYLRTADVDEAAREALLREHARQVRDHLRNLAAKSYWSRFQPAPEFVVMFMPAEPLFSAALQHDPALFDFAVDQRVIPASPLTLVALLRTVASAWQQQRLAKNAEEIRQMGKDLYERLSTMAEHIADVGDHLKKAGASYDAFVGSLDARVLASARRFKELGVSASKDLPDDLPSTHLDVRQPRAPELRVAIQESLIGE
ncbi:MAG TPA: DNA recombination protein RmuC [Vicinamibacterales bacterium]|nr:DNA recombination protein RmuC [Vicinamibacterales bacterium]